MEITHETVLNPYTSATSDGCNMRGWSRDHMVFSQHHRHTLSAAAAAAVAAAAGCRMLALLALVLAAPVQGILPDTVDSGLSHILGHVWSREHTDLEEEQLVQGAEPQLNVSATSPSPSPTNPPDITVTPLDQNGTSTTYQSNDLDNNINHGCITDNDCEKGGYCHSQAHRSKCMFCKTLDVPCTRDGECCDGHMCVWGQCTANASKGEAGSTCQTQSDCVPDLCCAVHKVLLFPICLSKPIEREQCFSASNHLMELLSKDPQDQGPRTHCPCIGDLHCQHWGRGSMCLKGEDSSEEDLTDNLYSEIDYVI